jgi:hypothetical protein
VVVLSRHRHSPELSKPGREEERHSRSDARKTSMSGFEAVSGMQDILRAHSDLGTQVGRLGK